MICLSVNTSFNEFLRKIPAINIISFWNCQKAIFCIIKATLHNNCHSLAIKLLSILLLVEYITKDSLFYEQLGRIRLQNNLKDLAFSDLFIDGTIYFTIGLELGRYIYAAYRN